MNEESSIFLISMTVPVLFGRILGDPHAVTKTNKASSEWRPVTGSTLESAVLKFPPPFPCRSNETESFTSLMYNLPVLLSPWSLPASPTAMKIKRIKERWGAGRVIVLFILFYCIWWRIWIRIRIISYATVSHQLQWLVQVHENLYFTWIVFVIIPGPPWHPIQCTVSGRKWGVIQI